MKPTHKTKTIQPSTIFPRLESAIGRQIAFYCLCAVCDIPFVPEDAEEENGWDEYEAAHEKGRFADGETDVSAAILAGMDEGDRWRTIWGEDYTEAEYRQLDDLYRTMTEQLDATGGIDRQQDDTARTCAIMALQRNKLLRSKDKDEVTMAKTFDQMIRDNLKDSNMRKADILPSQQQRPDGFVDALKKKTGLTPDMTKEQVMQAFFTWCRSKHYPETIDAEEHAMMAILRTMQKNDDMPEPQDLPSEFDFGPYEAQFEREPNEMEEDAYNYLGLVRGEYHKGEND